MNKLPIELITSPMQFDEIITNETNKYVAKMGYDVVFNKEEMIEMLELYKNESYTFEELKVGMYCHVFVNTEVPTFNMKVDALITKICDDKRIEFIFVVENGMVVYKRVPFKENRFYPREMKDNE